MAEFKNMKEIYNSPRMQSSLNNMKRIYATLEDVTIPLDVRKDAMKEYAATVDSFVAWFDDKCSELPR
jgi:hypothetical protein